MSCRIHLLGDNLHIEEGGVVGDVLEVLGIEPPSSLGVAHPDHKRSVQGEKMQCMLCLRKPTDFNELIQNVYKNMMQTMLLYICHDIY